MNKQFQHPYVSRVDQYWCEFVALLEKEAKRGKATAEAVDKHLEKECYEYLDIRSEAEARSKVIK